MTFSFCWRRFWRSFFSLRDAGKFVGSLFKANIRIVSSIMMGIKRTKNDGWNKLRMIIYFI